MVNMNTTDYFYKYLDKYGNIHLPEHEDKMAQGPWKPDNTKFGPFNPPFEPAWIKTPADPVYVDIQEVPEEEEDTIDIPRLQGIASIYPGNTVPDDIVQAQWSSSLRPTISFPITQLDKFPDSIAVRLELRVPITWSSKEAAWILQERLANKEVVLVIQSISPTIDCWTHCKFFHMNWHEKATQSTYAVPYNLLVLVCYGSHFLCRPPMLGGEIYLEETPGYFKKIGAGEVESQPNIVEIPLPDPEPPFDIIP